jgi:hypothetical protein
VDFAAYPEMARAGMVCERNVERVWWVWIVAIGALKLESPVVLSGVHRKTPYSAETRRFWLAGWPG